MRRAFVFASALLVMSFLTACTAEARVRGTSRRAVASASSSHALVRSAAHSAAPRIQRSSRMGSAISAAAVPVPTAPTPSTSTAPKGLGIPILVYHHIRPQQNWPKETWSWKMTVSPDVFDKQMQWLADRGYTTINLDTLAEILQGTQPGPTKPVVLTFDDNNLNSYEAGVPIMEKYGHTAVFYLVTNRLGYKDVINAERALDLVARGMDVQSHTVSHAGLTNVSIAEVDRQLVNSKRALEELLGHPVRHLAYPLTMQNATIREHAQQAGYVTATIMDPRPVSEGSDLFRLPRIMMTDDTNLSKVLP